MEIFFYLSALFALGFWLVSMVISPTDKPTLTTKKLLIFIAATGALALIIRNIEFLGFSKEQRMTPAYAATAAGMIVNFVVQTVRLCRQNVGA